MLTRKILSNQFIAEGEKVQIEEKSSKQKKQDKPEPKQNLDEDYFKLAELVENSQILFRTKTVFPFVFFPDEIIIDRDKVSIITAYFIASSRHQSILIKNISDAYVDTSLFFATLKLVDKYFSKNIVTIRYLKKKEAIFARNIIQGLMICQAKEVDISQMKRKELLLYLEEIGKATAR